jgi:hypothetical protein
VIVDPDFLDHWRTRMVVDALGDELAPIYILRLWAHCQARTSDRHAMPAAGLKAQCRAPHEAVKFEQALSEAGFVQRDGDSIVVLGWAEQNAALLAAWENGAKGGRPRKIPPQEPSQNPRVSSGKPTGNPSVTHGEPNENPDETDKSREEKNRGEGKKRGAAAPSLAKPEEVEQQTWDDWLAMRKRLKADVTATVLKEAHRESEKAGMPLQRFLEIWCLRGSRGLEAAWLRADERRPSAVVRPLFNQQEAIEESNRAVGERWLANQGLTP